MITGHIYVTDEVTQTDKLAFTFEERKGQIELLSACEYLTIKEMQEAVRIINRLFGEL